MDRNLLEDILLRKLENGFLDGVVGRDGVLGEITHRAVIIDGIPYLVTFPTAVGFKKDVTVAEYEVHTDEGKLWFLRNHGWKMQDPDAIRYCRTYRRPNTP